MSFLRNLVADLWAKRLLPVVALLLGAGAAIPVLMLHSTPAKHNEPAAGPEAGASAQALAAGQSIVTLVDPRTGEKTRLDAFRKKNPFRQQGLSHGGESGTTTVVGGGGDTGGGSGTTTSPSAGGTQGSPTNQTQGSEPRFYRWTVDVRFGLKGKVPPKQRITTLTPLPSSKDPMLVYLGISRSGAAVFLVDKGVSQTGEGTCMPSVADCNLLYLKDNADQNEHFVSRDPVKEYEIKLLGINLRPIPQGSPTLSNSSVGKQDTGSMKASSSPSKRAHRPHLQDVVEQ